MVSDTPDGKKEEYFELFLPAADWSELSPLTASAEKLRAYAKSYIISLNEPTLLMHARSPYYTLIFIFQSLQVGNDEAVAIDVSI